MSAKQLRFLLIALAALLVLWGASRLLSRGSDVVAGTLSLPAVTSGNADSVTVVHQADTIRLVRAGQRWSVNGYRASSKAVEDLFLAFADTSPHEVAALSPSSFERMGVDSAGGWWLQVSGGGRAVLRLVVGKSGTEYQSGYVRRPESDTVFLWRGPMPTLVRRGLDEWRDHQIAAVPADSVHRIDVQRGRRAYSLVARGGHWYFGAGTGGGAPADSGKVATLLGRFADLTVTQFATPAQADSSSRRRPQRTVTLRGTGDSVLVQLSLDSAVTTYFVRRSGDPNVYRMDSWQANGITPIDTTLRAAPAGKQTSQHH
jgi:hypothetical protein